MEPVVFAEQTEMFMSRINMEKPGSRDGVHINGKGKPNPELQAPNPRFATSTLLPPGHRRGSLTVLHSATRLQQLELPHLLNENQEQPAQEHPPRRKQGIFTAQKQPTTPAFVGTPNLSKAFYQHNSTFLLFHHS